MTVNEPPPISAKSRLQAATRAAYTRTGTFLEKRLARGNISALEQWYRNRIEEKYERQPEPFTGRQRGMLKDMVKRYGPDGTRLYLDDAISHYSSLLGIPALYGLPSQPTFDTLYTRREAIMAELRAQKAKRERENAQREQMFAHTSVSGRPKKSLLEMYKDVRAGKVP